MRRERPRSSNESSRGSNTCSTVRVPRLAPARASATARLAVTEDFPTPPLPEAMPMILAAEGIEVVGASRCAALRARSIRMAFASGLSWPMAMSTVSMPPTDRAAWLASRSIWPKARSRSKKSCSKART